MRCPCRAVGGGVLRRNVAELRVGFGNERLAQPLHLPLRGVRQKQHGGLGLRGSRTPQVHLGGLEGHHLADGAALCVGEEDGVLLFACVDAVHGSLGPPALRAEDIHTLALRVHLWACGGGCVPHTPLREGPRVSSPSQHTSLSRYLC